MHKIKLECLALAKTYAQNLDELFDYGDKIQNYIFDATANEVRRVFYVGINDMLPEEAEATLKKAMNYVVGVSSVTGEAQSTDDIPVWMPTPYRIKETLAAAEKTFTKCANAEMAPIPDEPAFHLLRDIDNAILHEAIISEPVEPVPDLIEALHFKNYITRDAEAIPHNLRPALIEAAQIFEDGQDVVLNSSRQIGTSTLIAALARHYMARKARITSLQGDALHRVLVLTNSNGSREMLMARIDDGTVNIMTFAEAAKSSPHDKGYSIVLIDNAAFIPYASENNILSFIAASGMADIYGNITKPKIFMASVPGHAMGLFYNMFTSDNEHITPIAISWKDAGLAYDKRMLKLMQEIGQESFDNEYCNKFRPVK